MKTQLARTVLLLCFALLGGSPTYACGGKFLVMSKSVSKAQCYIISEKLVILMYIDSENGVASQGLTKDFYRQLKSSGQAVQVARTRDELEKALAGAKFDAVLCDFAVADDVQKSLRAHDNGALVIPVIDDQDAARLDQAKQRYTRVIRSSERTSTKILTVYDAFNPDNAKTKVGS